MQVARIQRLKRCSESFIDIASSCHENDTSGPHNTEKFTGNCVYGSAQSYVDLRDWVCAQHESNFYAIKHVFEMSAMGLQTQTELTQTSFSSTWRSIS